MGIRTMLITNLNIIIISTTISLHNINDNQIFYFTDDYTDVAHECMRKNGDHKEDINDILYKLIREQLEEEDKMNTH